MLLNYSRSGLRMRRSRFAATFGLLSLVLASAAIGQTTVNFQQGVDGYNGTLDVIIGPPTTIADFTNVLGSTVEEHFLDGRYHDVDPSGANVDDKHLLIRFDNIFGDGPGQIPSGATIENASFILTTGATSGNAQSGGPYGVAQMLVPFDDLTTWFDLFDLGATFDSGHTDRPLDRGFRGPLEASTITPSQQSADVTPVVRNWVNGQANEGLAVRAGTADGWQIFTTGATNEILRPRLEVTYNTDPQPEVDTVVLQQGTDGYFGTTMARLNQDDITDDGELFDLAFLDGGNLAGTSPDDQALIRFDNIFESDGGPVPDNVLITDAQLILDTAPATFSINVGTNGNYGVHQMLADWDFSTIYSDFGSDGPSEADGEIGPLLDETGAMIADARSRLDVTAAVSNWQAGESNFGLNVQAVDTADGWAIHWLGSISPPQLMISFTDALPPVDLPGDYNGNGTVEQADLDLVLLNWGASFDALPPEWVSERPESGIVAQAQLDGVLLNWGNTAPLGTAAGVPEPATLGLGLALALAGFALVRRRPSVASASCLR